MLSLNPLRSAFRAAERFDDDEEGMETIQVVMLLGLAAVVAVLIFAFWKQIKAWFETRRSHFNSEAGSVN